MKNTIETFTLFVRKDEKSEEIAESIRSYNQNSSKPLQEVSYDGDLIIAIGGDGTFLRAVNKTDFDKTKLYTGIHTGTLGFLQNISANEVSFLIKKIHAEKELSVRKMLVSSVTVNLTNKKSLHYYSLNEVLVVGKNYSKISFEEHINGELLQNVSGNGITVATNTGDTAYSMNSGGAIDFSNHYQLVCTLETPIKNASYERFISNPIICSEVSIVPKPSDNIDVIIDGIPKSIDSSQIKSIVVSMLDGNYINKFELGTYSKVNVIRKKILGYDF